MGDISNGYNHLKKEVKESKEQVSNPQFPIVESFFARDWLNRFFSLKGEEKLQKFLIRGISEKEVEKLLKELDEGKGKLAVIVEKPPYQEYPDFPIIEGLSDYEMFDKGFSALSDEAYVQRLKALLYTSPISPKSRAVSFWEETEELGRLFERKIEKLSKEGGSVEEIEALKEKVKAINEVLEFRRKELEKVKEGWEEFLNAQKELANPYALEFMEELSKVPENLHAGAGIGALLKRLEYFDARVSSLLGQINDRGKTEWIYDKDWDWNWLKKTVNEMAKEAGIVISDKSWEGYKKKWEYYKALTNLLPESLALRRRFFWQMKRWFLKDIALSETAKLVLGLRNKGELEGHLALHGLIDLFNTKGQELSKEDRELLYRTLKERKNNLFLTEEELKKLKEGLKGEEFKEFFKEVEETAKRLGEKSEKAYKLPLFLPVKKYYAQEEVENLEERFFKEIREKRKELSEFLEEIVEEYFSLESKLRALKEPSFVDNASRVYNLDLLREKVRNGKFPVNSLTDEEVAKIMGLSPTSSLVKSIKTYLKEVEGERLERTFSRYPLYASDYLKMLKDIEYLSYARKFLIKKKPVSDFVSSRIRKLMEKKNIPALEAVSDGIKKGIFALGVTFNYAGLTFYECLREASYPPEYRRTISSRIKDCFERYFSNLERSVQNWEHYALSMGNYSVVNPLRLPLSLFAYYFALIRNWESSYAKTHFHLFQEELQKKADEIIYSSPENIDEKMKNTVYEVTGVRFDVKYLHELSRLEKEESILEPVEILEKALQSLKEGNREEAKRNIELLLVGTEGERLLPQVESLLEKEKVSEEEIERLKAEILKEINPHELKITIFSKGNRALVVSVNAQRLRELGEGDFIEELKEKGQKTGRVLLLKRLGISESLVQEGLESGRIRNGMEYHEIWENVANSLAARIVREVREEKTEELEEEEREGFSL